MRLGALLTAALLAGCAPYEAGLASRRMIGISRADMETCAGVPEHEARLGTTTIDTYGYESKGAGLSVGFPFLGTLNLSSAGQCTAVWRLDGDRVTSLRYTAAAAGLSMPEAACAPLVRGCLAMLAQRHRTPIPTVPLPR